MAGDSYGEIANLLIGRFDDIKSNIDSSLTPACEAMDQLKENLQKFKEEQKKLDTLLDEKEVLDKELQDLNNELDSINSQMPVSNGEDDDEYNSNYSIWLSQVNEVQNKISNKQNEIDLKQKEVDLQEKNVKEIQKKCDELLSKIKKLENNIREFSDMAGFTAEFSTGEFSKMPNLDDMKYEERIEYLNDLVDNYKVIYDGLNEFFEDKYGNGLKFTREDFKKIDELFDSFDIYWMSKVDRNYLVKDETSDSVLFDINKLSQVMSYCDSNDVFGKIGNYVNGQSWKESGLEKLYDGFWDTGSANFMNFNAFNENVLNQRMKDKYGVTGDVREYLKENYSSMIESVTNLKDTYKEYSTIYSTMAVVKSKIDNINNALKLLPYESYMDNDQFAKFMDVDYSNYNGLSKDMLGKLNQQEVALYEYLRTNASFQEATDYLQILQKTVINEREGMKKAQAYVEGLKNNGFDVGDLLVSGWEGTKDGVRNFFDGIADVFRVANTGEGEYSELDYEMRYKAQFIQELMQDEAYLNPDIDHDTLGLLNINNWYNTGTSVGNMLVPSVVGFIPVVGQGISSALMTASITGNTAVEAKQEGYSTGQAYLYGALSGASETFTEVMFGGIPGISNLEGKGFLAGMFSEGLEEFAQEYMDVGLKALVLHEPVELGLTAAHERFSNATQAGVQGAITSGVMQVGNSVIGVGVNGLTKAVSPVKVDSSGSAITGIDGNLVKKYNNFAEFKNSIESEHYTTRANNQIEHAMSKIESGDSLNLVEKVELNKAIKNVSADELANLTNNYTQEQTNMLKNATEGIPFVSKNTLSKLETSNYIKEMNSSSSDYLPTENLTKDILREEATRDGRSVAEYIADSKPSALDNLTIRKIESIDSKVATEIVNRVESNQKAYSRQLNKVLKNEMSSNTLQDNSNEYSNNTNLNNSDSFSSIKDKNDYSYVNYSDNDNRNLNNNQDIAKVSYVSNQATNGNNISNTINPASTITKTVVADSEVSSINNSVNNNSDLNSDITDFSSNKLQNNISSIHPNSHNSSIIETNISPKQTSNFNDSSNVNNTITTASTNTFSDISLNNLTFNSAVSDNVLKSSNTDSSFKPATTLGLASTIGIGLNSMFPNTVNDGSNNDNVGGNKYESFNSSNLTTSSHTSSNEKVLSSLKYADNSSSNFNSYTYENTFDNKSVDYNEHVTDFNTSLFDSNLNVDSVNDDLIVEKVISDGEIGDFDISNSRLKDISYVLNVIQKKYQFSYEMALRVIENVAKSGDYNFVTRENNARNILKKYSTSELIDIIKELNKTNNVTDADIKKIEFCIDKLMERYQLSREDAIENVKCLIDSGNYRYMTSYGNAREIIKEFSIEKIGNILNKIKINSYLQQINSVSSSSKSLGIPLIDSIVKTVNFGNAPNSVQLLFDNNVLPSSFTYGVNQGTFYSMFDFYDINTNKKYSYNQAKQLYVQALKNHDVLPKFSKRASDEYFSFKEKVMSKYGLSSRDASIIMESIDDTGACSYATVCNEIFSSFLGKEESFESKFGFSMYVETDGKRILNSKELLFDLYLNINSSGKNGLIIKTKDGYIANYNSLKVNVDPLGRKMLDSDSQLYLSTSAGKNQTLINQYLNEKGISLNSNVIKQYNTSLNESMMSRLLNQVISGLSSGKIYGLGIYSSGRPITMYSTDTNSYRSVSTTNWSEGGGHSVYITGLTEEGFVVSSWGKKYIIAYSDLVNNGSWILLEDSFDLDFHKKFGLSALKSLFNTLG